jgi:peroxiredoxin
MKWRGLEESAPAQHATTLRQELEERRMLAEQYVPAEIQEINRQTVEYLRASGIAAQALSVGAHAPAFELPDQDNKPVSSAELLRRGRLVICFFRGRWCPFCVAQLEAMNSALPSIRSVGASLVAVSPQTLKQSFFMHDQHHLQFPLLSDAGNQVARRFGLVYRVPEPQKEVYSHTFINLPFINGDASWELPVPATYVLNPDATVMYSSVEADYTRRPEPEAIVGLLLNPVG